MKFFFEKWIWGYVAVAGPVFAEAGRADSSALSEQWNIHFQSTVVSQVHPAFPSAYSGDNSLSADPEWETSLTSTLFLGAKLWPNGQAYFNPELSGGSGFSHTQGIAGFPNGEIYRVSTPAPKINLARLYFQQTVNLGGGHERIEGDANQLGGMADSSRLTLSIGRFSLADFFDGNDFSHDARSQFLDWSLMDYGAWDYAADTKGYTWGAVLEFRKWDKVLRLASVKVPKSANGMDMDPHILRARSDDVELEMPLPLGPRPLIVRLLGYENFAHMGRYRTAIDDPGDSRDITRSRAYRMKYGFGFGLEEHLSEAWGLFLRASWNDGATETWAFTEIDRSLSLGTQFIPYAWGRKHDRLGMALVANGLSQDHQDYLAAGGYGFIIGDGHLRYRPELIAEGYCLLCPWNRIGLTASLQEVVNPAYNADRGPVSIFSFRAHWEI